MEVYVILYIEIYMVLYMEIYGHIVKTHMNKYGPIYKDALPHI